MRFTISPSILAQWSRVTAWQVYTLCDSVVCQQTRGRGVSQATRMSWPSSMSPPPKVSSPISLSFTSLPPSLRFVPPCPCLGSPCASLLHSCVTDLLFSPRFWEIFAIPTFLGSFQLRLVSESEWLRHPGYCQEFKIIRRCLVSPETLLIRGKGTNILVVSLASAAIDRPEDKSESWGLTLDHHHYHYKVNVLRKDDISKHCCQYCAPVSYNKCQGSFSAVWFLTELWWSVGNNKSQTMRKIVVEIIHSSGWNWDGVS